MLTHLSPCVATSETSGGYLLRLLHCVRIMCSSGSGGGLTRSEAIPESLCTHAYNATVLWWHCEGRLRQIYILPSLYPCCTELVPYRFMLFIIDWALNTWPYYCYVGGLMFTNGVASVSRSLLYPAP